MNAIDLQNLRQYRRDIEEHALRMLAAQRDFPVLNHKGSVPEVLRTVPQCDLAKIRQEFERA